MHDGDTLKLADGRTVRLKGIDAPEIAQPYGIESRNLLTKLTRKKKVRIAFHGKDRYGRAVGEIFVGKRSVNHSMVSHGAAWWFRSFAPTDNQLRRLEDDARKHKVGAVALVQCGGAMGLEKSQRQTCANCRSSALRLALLAV